MALDSNLMGDKIFEKMGIEAQIDATDQDDETKESQKETSKTTLRQMSDGIVVALKGDESLPGNNVQVILNVTKETIEYLDHLGDPQTKEVVTDISVSSAEII